MIDPAGREHFYALIEGLVRTGKTVIQITHSAEDAARSSRCLVLDKGVVIYDGPSHEVPGQRIVSSIKAPLPGTRSEITPPSFTREAAREARVSFNRVSHTYLPGTIHERTALNAVSLAIGENESIAIVGATGCGKSTVLKHINALLLPTAGRVAVFGQDTLDRNTSLDLLRRRVSLALQSPENALFEAHVADDIAYGARNAGLKGKPLVDRVRDVMNAVGLPFDEFADRETFTLSGGEARLAALAGVFVLDSDVVLLDEPTSGLDGEHSARILSLLEDLKRRGKTVVVSTHSMELAGSFDRVVSMIDGSLADGNVAPGNPGFTASRNMETAGAAGTMDTARPSKRRRKTGLEFFRGALPGIFLGIDSPLRRLPAGVKLLSTTLCVLAAAVIPGAVFPVGLLAVLLILGKVGGKIRPAHLVRGLLSMFPVLALFIALRLLFSWPEDTSRVLLALGPVTITVQEVTETAIMLIHLFTMMTAITLYSSVTSLRETLNVMKRLFSTRASPRHGKPASPNKSSLARDAGLALGIAFRFVPLITAEAEHIAASQISRGAKTRGMAVLSTLKAMMVPLFLRSLERAQTLAKAMLLRLYR
jgi:energy-coupling factor transport system ATP-binding protein